MMPVRRLQKPGKAISLTRTERKAADIDSAVKRTLAKTRADHLKKIAHLKALRLAAGPEQ